MKPLPILSHMPWNVLQQIVGSTDQISRLSLRKCSRKLREVVENTACSYQSISLDLRNDKIIFDVLGESPPATSSNDASREQRVSIEYHYHPEGCIIRNGEWEKLIEGEHFITKAVADFATLIRNRKVYVKQLRCVVTTRIFTSELSEQNLLDEITLSENYQQVLSKLDHKLKVGSWAFRPCVDMDRLMNMLTRFEPGVLEGVSICFDHNVRETAALVNTEQWKMAKQMNILGGSRFFSISSMIHFRSLTMLCLTVSVEDVKMLVESALKHGDNFERVDLSFINYESYWGSCQYLSQFPTGYHSYEKRYEVPIPKSTNILLISVLGFHFRIDLKSR